MNTREDAMIVADVLNELLSLDRTVATALVEARYSCNNAVSDHPDFVVVDIGGTWKIGMLGVINALFDAEHRVAVSYNDDDEIIGFEVLDISDRKKGDERG